ncbi:MAG: S9 family peptidase [Psychrobium sp.]|nr:S9 family peptidase [Psychrobium sp.]
MVKRLAISLGLGLAIVGCQATTEQTPLTIQKDQQLTLERIYKNNEFRSQWIGRIRWLSDGSGYTAVEKSATKKKNDKGELKSVGRDIVVYDPKTNERTVLITAEQLTLAGEEKPLQIDNYIWSKDRQQVLIYTNSKKVWRSNSRGDYYVLNLTDSSLVKLGASNYEDSRMMFAKFSPDASKVAYVYLDNIYVQNLNSKKITQLTKDASKSTINGLFDWVYEEEFTIKDGFRWSPDGSKIAYWQLDTSGSKNFTMINNTDELYPTITTFPYPKVGEKNPAAKVGVVSLKTQKTVWANFTGDAHEMYIPRMSWADNSDEIIVQRLNRKQDTNKVYLVNANNGKLNHIYTEKEETFIEWVYDVTWVDNGKAFLWISEQDDWRHVYKISRDGKSIVDLTPGQFDITALKSIDEKNGWIYFIASPENITQRYLYRAPLDGNGDKERLTPNEFAGYNSYYMDDKGQWAIHSHSSFAVPSTKRLVSLSDHKTQRVMLENKKLKAKLASLNIAKTEFFQVKAQDGVVLDGYITKPADFDASKKYPIIFYVYGEPAGQTVKDSWRGNAFFWDQMLTEQGFIVASIDNRGAAVPKGREWRKSIYAKAGVITSRDQSDALKAMAKRYPFIDTDNVAIWGHSGGGSMTLNMLFRYPEQYKVGIALAPVADIRLYDTIYQERYSGILSDNVAAYEDSAPITHAKNLQGNLLLIHGTADDNVHYQGSERLINELIKHNKQFDFMSYPNRSHGLWEGKGTTLHIKTMMTEYFKRHLKK